MSLDTPVMEGLDPRLGVFGKLIGLLDTSTIDPDEYVLLTEWFSDPIGNIGDMVEDHPQELLDVIMSFLGDAIPSPLDKDSGEIWHAIEYPKGGKQVPTGISLVAKPAPEAGEDANGNCRISLGISYDPFAAKEGEEKPSLKVHLLAQLPVLDLATRTFLLGRDDEPIQLALELRSGDGKPFSAANDTLALTGMDVVSSLFTNKVPDVQFLMKGLVLGGSDPSDMDVIEMVKDPTTLLSHALESLLVLALQNATAVAAKGKSGDALDLVKAMQQSVLWLLGLPSPKGKKSEIPPVQWAKLIGDGFGAEWERWFLSIVDDAPTLRAWLHGLYCMAQGLDVYDRVADRDEDLHGKGTIADPFSVNFFDGGDAGPSFDLTLAVDGAGPTMLTLGARMVTPTKHGGAGSDLDFDISGHATLAEIPLGGPSGPKLDIKPSFVLSATAKRPSGETLFDYTDNDPTYSISPDQFSIGLKMDVGASQPVPFGDFKQEDVKTLSFVDMLTRGADQFDPLQMLMKKLHDDTVWKAVFNELLPPESGITYDQGKFAYGFDTTIKDRPVTVRLVGGLEGVSGLKVDADVGVTINPLALSLTTGVVLNNVLENAPPVFTFTGTARGDEEHTNLVPQLITNLNEAGIFTLVGALPIEGFEDPIKLGLIPLTGLEGFSADKLVPMIEEAVLDYPGVKTWLEAPVTQDVKDCSWASILTKWGFFTTSVAAVTAAEHGEDAADATDLPNLRLPALPSGAVDVDALLALRPDELIKMALSEYLQGIDEVLLYRIGETKKEDAYKDASEDGDDSADDEKTSDADDGEKKKDVDGVYLTHDKNIERYGLRLAMADIVVSGGTSGENTKEDKDEDKEEKTKVVLQAGKWMSPDAKGKNGETDKSNWLTKSWKDGTPPARGIHLDLVQIVENQPKFDLKLRLISVGIDVEGTNKNPLFDIKGYSAEGGQLRVYLDDAESPIKLGGAVRVDRAAIPLGPSQGPKDGTKNPVASGLLSSGDTKTKSSDEGKTGDGAPVNPEFGVQISYAQKFDAEILNDDPNAGGKVWIPINKSYGPMFCRKVGLGFNGTPDLLVGFDGSVELGPLGIDLMDFSIGIPLKNPQKFEDYSLDLGGLDLSFNGGPVEISGSFLESIIHDPNDCKHDVVQYTGAALIKTEAFSIAGLGSYASLNGAPSMFVFAVLDKDLGGPAFFHVTALAAGFGFKRKLLVPSIEQVQEFPLVKVISDPNYIGNSDDPKEALQKLSEAIPPDPDSYWLAAGIRFRSFEQIETVALLAVTFGSEVTVSVLGVSTLTVPPNLKAAESPVCYAELALRAEFNPAVGVLSVEGRLTSNSYVFDPSCKLTGGFAFYTWFRGDFEGDFVVTLGGYHPNFQRPDHYPIVPRLGLDWKTGDVRITGELYFALTPACLMAGGKLAAVYDIGWAKAWFTAYADFLISWKPFHYDISVGVSIGASATVSIDLGLFTISKTFKFELGADLHIWGPDFAGTVRIKFYVVSFTVRFGNPGPQMAQPIKWEEFASSFLPKKESVCSVTYAGGLMQEWEKPGSKVRIPIVNAHELALNVQSMAPCTSVNWRGAPAPGGDTWKGKLGVKPMYASDLNSDFNAELTAKNGFEIAEDIFDFTVVGKGFPDAMWGQGAADLKNPSAKVLGNGKGEGKVPAGVMVRLSEKGKQSNIRHSLPAMELSAFAYEPIDKSIYWGNESIPDRIDAKGKKSFADTITSNKRAPVMAALTQAMPNPLNTVDLTETAARAGTIYQSEPTYAALGQLLPQEV